MSAAAAADVVVVVVVFDLALCVSNLFSYPGAGSGKVRLLKGLATTT